MFFESHAPAAPCSICSLILISAWCLMSSVCTRTSAKILDQQSDLPECTEDSILSCFVLCSPTLAVLALEIIGYSLSSGPEPFMIVPNCSVLIYVRSMYGHICICHVRSSSRPGRRNDYGKGVKKLNIKGQGNFRLLRFIT